MVQSSISLPPAPREPKWVFLALYSGDEESARRAESTWFRRDKGIGRVAMGFYREADVECRSPWVGGSEFHNMRRAFLQASRCFPHARLFARLNIDSKVDRAGLIRQVEALPGADYLGLPVRSGGLVFASGADGYVLSLESVRRLESCTPPPQFDGFEDASVGACLSSAGIGLVYLHKHMPFEFPFDFFTVFLLYFNNNTLLNKFPIITFENS